LVICLVLVSIFCLLSRRFSYSDNLYYSSSVIISESALALLDTSSLSPLARQGGVLTSMSALGETLIRRLEISGRFEFESRVLDEDEVARGAEGRKAV
jgi:hypothetical protein